LYLVITVPLTHAVNAIDRRLRDGRRADGAEHLDDDPVGPAAPSLELAQESHR
jgi:polar amino acid transport system permease protein/polar amino acid transport system substrate-binding protein